MTKRDLVLGKLAYFLKWLPMAKHNWRTTKRIVAHEPHFLTLN